MSYSIFRDKSAARFIIPIPTCRTLTLLKIKLMFSWFFTCIFLCKHTSHSMILVRWSIFRKLYTLSVTPVIMPSSQIISMTKIHQHICTHSHRDKKWNIKYTKHLWADTGSLNIVKHIAGLTPTITHMLDSAHS